MQKQHIANSSLDAVNSYLFNSLNETSAIFSQAVSKLQAAANKLRDFQTAVNHRVGHFSDAAWAEIRS